MQRLLRPCKAAALASTHAARVQKWVNMFARHDRLITSLDKPVSHEQVPVLLLDGVALPWLSIAYMQSSW